MENLSLFELMDRFGAPLIPILGYLALTDLPEEGRIRSAYQVDVMQTIPMLT